MSTFKEDLCKMLKAVRLACGYSQSTIATALGVCRSTYSYYELGKTTPDLVTLRDLAAVFGIPPEAFLYPENYLSVSSARVRARGRRKAFVKPEHIGQLSTEEKQLIAKLRVERLAAQSK